MTPAQFLPALGVAATLSVPGLWLLVVEAYKRIGARPSKQAQTADMAKVISDAFEGLVEGLQAENARNLALVKTAREEVHRTNNKLMILNKYVKDYRLAQDAYLSELEARVLTLGGELPPRPILPPLPDFAAI